MQTLTIRYSRVRPWALAFLAVPVLIFFLSYLKLYIGVILSVILGFLYVWIICKPVKKEKTIEISWMVLVILFLLILLWCYLGGLGNMFYQTSDWNERNAIFRDLIEYDWPVYYPATNTMLTYYTGLWLVSAVFGKMAFLVTGSLSQGFAIGNVLLLFWTAAGIFLTWLMMLLWIGAKSNKAFFLIFFILVIFSGLDFLGTFMLDGSWETILSSKHLEWWATPYQFSSNTTQLFWVFNQAIPAWVATLIFMNEDTCSNYAFLIGVLLLSASLPSVGLGLLLVANALVMMGKAVSQKKAGAYFRELFSLSNIVSFIFVVIPVGLYLMANSAFEKTMDGTSEGVDPTLFTINAKSEYLLVMIVIAAVVFGVLLWRFKKRRENKAITFLVPSFFLLVLFAAVSAFSPNVEFKRYVLFLLLEVGIYWIFLIPQDYSNPLFYLIAASFILYPSIRVGIGSDFCMRATIPPLMILCTLCAQSLVNWQAHGRSRRYPKVKTVCNIGLSVTLLIGAATPAVEVVRGIYYVAQAGRQDLTYDEIKTLNQYHSSGGIYGNFVSDTYQNSLFFKYLAKENPAEVMDRRLDAQMPAFHTPSSEAETSQADGQ
ncbi:hypothetical protein [uncultured Allobaculum sp.]|uniref:hypothetical protein n=1 Tax=uncultured Allobaculum sp. TaxID=1187017 RepID=UPI00258D2A90|nr:hypothetical protein [uncultured Allobaculum sp.]